jgi:hypothetical protein
MRNTISGQWPRIGKRHRRCRHDRWHNSFGEIGKDIYSSEYARGLSGASKKTLGKTPVSRVLLRGRRIQPGAVFFPNAPRISEQRGLLFYSDSCGAAVDRHGLESSQIALVLAQLASRLICWRSRKERFQQLSYQEGVDPLAWESLAGKLVPLVHQLSLDLPPAVADPLDSLLDR